MMDVMLSGPTKRLAGSSALRVGLSQEYQVNPDGSPWRVALTGHPNGIRASNHSNLRFRSCFQTRQNRYKINRLLTIKEKQLAERISSRNSQRKQFRTNNCADFSIPGNTTCHAIFTLHFPLLCSTFFAEQSKNKTPVLGNAIPCFGCATKTRVVCWVFLR